MLNDRDIYLILSNLNEIYIGKSFIKKLSGFNDFPELFSADLDNFKSKLTHEEIHKLKEIRQHLEKTLLEKHKKDLESKGVKFAPYCDKEYPQRLKDIIDPPFGLFYKGDLDLLNKKSVAIVGTRNASDYGLKMAQEISSLLSKQGVIVISGMASGIDASAHKGTLDHGKTIAVLGTGADVVYPKSNEGLYEKIFKQNGLIISEYPPGTEGAPWNFPQRNRIISALSDAIIVIEGDIQSGAMITARFAIKHGKPLFALPGPIDSQVSNGPNILIKSGVAELLASVNDVLEKIGEAKQIQLGLKDSNEKLEDLSEKQKNLFKILSNQPKSFDGIISEINLTVQDLIKELSIMELKGFIEKTTDGTYVKC